MAKFSATNFAAAFASLGICCAALPLLFFPRLGLARDLDGKYRVWLDGQWIEVPPDALVTVPNKFGLAVVWPYKDYEGRTQIRCFIPGAGG